MVEKKKWEKKVGVKKSGPKKSQKSWKKSWGEKKSGSKKNVINKFKKKWG